MSSSLIASRAASGTAGMLRSTLMPPNDLLRLGFDAGTGSTRTMGQHIHGVHTRESATIREVQLRPDQEVAISQVMLLPPKGEIVYGDHDVDNALHQNRALFDGKVIRRHKLGLHPEFRDIPDVVHMWGVISAEKDPWAIVDLFEDWFRALFNDARAAFKRPDLNTSRPDSYWDAIPLEIHISVPAMWSDRQRGMVRMAAQRAAKASGKSVKEPLIALREEALCVATQFLSKDSSAKVGSICIFVDVGDGTLDITTVRVIRAHSTEAPMQLERVGICSGSGAGSSMINAAALAWVRETYKQELDLRLLQLGISWPEFSRQLWEQIDAIKLIVDKPGTRRLRAVITSSHGRVGPGKLNDWTIEFPEEAIAQWYDTWTTAADQLLVQHLSTLSTERPMADVSAKVTGGGASSSRYVARMKSRFAQYKIDCTATNRPMACAEGTLMQHCFPEDKLPNRANFYVTVNVHSNDAAEEEPEDNGYEAPDEESDGDGDSDEDEGIFMGETIVESNVKSGRKRSRSGDRKDTYLPDRTKIIGSYSNGEFTSMEPVSMVFHVAVDGRHLGRIHTDLYMSKLRFAEHTPLKDDEGNLIPGVCSYPSMFADLDNLKAKGFEVHDSGNNRPPHFEVKAYAEMTGSSEKLLLTLHVMKSDYEFPDAYDCCASTINEENRLFEHTQEVWSKGCSHFTSNTTGTSSSGGDDSAEAAEPTREVRKRQCKR